MAGNTVKFSAVGDVLIGRGMKKTFAKHSYHYPFRKVAKYFRKRDLVMANLESPATRRGRPVKKLIRFQGDPAALPAFRKAGITLVTLGNNHTLDYGRIGLLDTMTHLSKHKIEYVGAGRTALEAHKPLILEKNGLRIAFLSYTVFPTYGVAYNPGLASVAMGEKATVVCRDIKNVRDKVDLIIIAYHWGREFASKPTALQRFLAHSAINAGADLIIGHHSHVLQPVRHHKGKLIVYSLGNFIFDMTRPHTRHSAIFSCTLTKTGVKHPKLLPVIIKNSRPKIMKNPRIRKSRVR